MHFGKDCSSTQTTSQETRGHRWVLAPILDNRHRIAPFSECVPLSNAIKRKTQKHTRRGQAAPVENSMGCSLLHPPLERLDFILHPLHPPLWIPALSPSCCILYMDVAVIPGNSGVHPT